MAGLTIIEGIGDTFAKKLSEAGVATVESLLTAGGTRVGREELAQRTGIDGSRLLRFVNHADLMRVKGIGGEYAELLEATGVDSVRELAQRNAENLHAAMVTTNESKKLVRSVAAPTVVAGWVEQAKSLPRAVEY